MSFASRHNKSGVNFDIDTKDFTFKSLKDLYKENGKNCEYAMYGAYINRKSEYGDHPVAIIPELMTLADFPASMTEEVEGMLMSDEDISDIKEGKAVFKIKEYKHKKYKKLCYGIEWV